MNGGTNMKKTKKFLAIVCIIAIVSSFTLFGAFAGSGSGWTTGSLKLNNVAYDFNLYITASNRCYQSHANTQAYVARDHLDLSCKWTTQNHGQQTAVDGAISYAAIAGETHSYTVECPVGVITEYTRASTQIRFYCDHTGTHAVVW